MKRSLLIHYSDALSDPPSKQTCTSLAANRFKHLLLQSAPPDNRHLSRPLEFNVFNFQKRSFTGLFRPFGQVFNWLRYRRLVANTIREFRPEWIVTIMLNPLAALPCTDVGKKYKLACCIYDIPACEHLGRLDRQLATCAWQRLRHADLVWSSDIYKAEFAQRLGQLVTLPIVCHNCPTRDYLPEPGHQRDGWLRATLRQHGANIGESGGSVLLRAGAIGECGGVEATLEAMCDLPDDCVFVMLGRPPADYARTVRQLISRLGLERRAFLFERPSDEIWKRALQGADIGHLIHGPFPQGRMARLYELNSSLSNNRLFQYMAAGLPILAYDDPRMSEMYSEVDSFRIVRLENLALDLRIQLKELYSNPKLRLRLGNAAREAHVSKYNWEKQFSPVLESINNNLFI